jgi:hypothetical protein
LFSREFKKKSLPVSLLSSAEIVRFHSEKIGSWQTLPLEISNKVQSCDIVIKFGMNLLKIDDSWEPPRGVISYHHGDPKKFRGRPPAFHEMINEEKTVGVIVQRLTNNLDGGKILSMAESKVFPYSYRKTLRRLYKTGIPLLDKAVRRHSANSEDCDQDALGPVYKYPSNLLVFSLIIKNFKSLLKFLYYGVFIEKVWSVACVSQESLQICNDSTIKSYQALPKKHDRISIADPVGAIEAGVFIEKIEKSNNGRIIFWNGIEYLDSEFPETRHFSFPSVVEYQGDVYVLPETARHSSPRLYRVSESGIWDRTTIVLQGLEKMRLKDPFLIKYEKMFYLFGSEFDSEQRLELFVSNNLAGPYEKHADSPISITPMGSRMAGPLHFVNDKVYRFGQDCSVGYGRGVVVFEILKLSSDCYREERVNYLSVKDQLGPHSLLFHKKCYFFDFYVEKFSLLAGWQRLMSLVGRPF